MSTTKLGSGLAFGARKDLELLRNRPSLRSPTRHTRGPGYFDIFDAAGWTLVFSAGGTHIFKAVPGTPPVHTAEDSQRDELRRQRNQFGRYSAVALVVLVLVAVWLGAVSWSVGIETAILVVAIIPVICTVMPLLGFAYRLHRFPSPPPS